MIHDIGNLLSNILIPLISMSHSGKSEDELLLNMDCGTVGTYQLSVALARLKGASPKGLSDASPERSTEESVASNALTPVDWAAVSRNAGFARRLCKQHVESKPMFALGEGRSSIGLSKDVLILC